MNCRDLIVLLPCESLETLVLQRSEAESEQILAAWTALYHPALCHAAGAAPRWTSADAPPEDPSGALLVIPPCAEPRVPADWIASAQQAGACLVRGFQARDQALSAALAHLDAVPPVEPALAADFLALGLCHLLVELLTRQLRYMSTLDEARFKEHLLEAAARAIVGEATAARESLRAAFDRVTEAREYFYPAQTHLVDLTLVAESTLGPSLRAELASGRPVSLLISGRTLEVMADREPESLAMLRAALEAGTAAVVGGSYDEPPWPLLPPETALADLHRGLAVYERLLGRRPTIFGRRCFGLSPAVPQWLKQTGFEGALHFTLDEGRLPGAGQSKIRWEGIGSSEIDALARLPLDATLSETFLQLPQPLGGTLDTDYGGAIVLAHWPGQSSPWLDDLRRAADYGPALGQWVTLPDYFQSTYLSGRHEDYRADKYRGPYLRGDVAAGSADPVSRTVAEHRRQATADAVAGIGVLTALATGRAPSAAPSGGDAEAEFQAALAEMAARLPRAPSGAEASACLIVNPLSFARQVVLEDPPWPELPSPGGPVVAVRQADQRRQVLAEVPAMGFAWIGPARPGAKPAPPPPDEPPLVEGTTLRNEHFQVQIDPHGGGIQSFQGYAVRGNRIGQQLALRLGPPPGAQNDAESGGLREYSRMVAEAVEVLSPGPLAGRLRTRGRLVDGKGAPLARFVQTLEVRRGSRVLGIEIELDAARLPEGDPWDAYYAARFAWADESAELFRDVALSGQRSEVKLLESPRFVDLRAARTRLTILTGGLSYHRRFGLRKLDTLLIVPGETVRRFRLGLGIDLPQAGAAAVEFSAPPAVHWTTGRTAAPPAGWFFHLDSRNVVATHWELLTDAGRTAGFRVRLLETEGRQTTLALRSFRDLRAARATDFLGQAPRELPVGGDRVTIDVAPRQWVQVEAEFE